MRWSLTAALVFAFASSALATAYDDFSRGVDANNRGDSSAAIPAFSRAIEAGDLAAPYLPSAYLGRARAYLGTQQCAAAAADLNKVSQLRPNDADALRLRAIAEECLGRPDAAVRDISAAIALRPVAEFYFERARILWGRDDYGTAVNDVYLAAQQEPSNPYFLLWTAIIGKRAGYFDPAAYERRAAKFEDGSWPQPLLALFGGQARTDDVYRSAAAGTGRTPANQKCEADFYIGEWRILQGHAQAAKPLILAAVNECPRSYLAWQGATAEYRRLGQTHTASLP